MGYIEFSQKLEYLEQMIRKGSTGSVDQISKHLCVSPRTVRRMVSFLRVKGYRIRYCRYSASYVDESSEISKN